MRRVVTCRIMERPMIEEIGETLDAMQRFVGGWVEAHGLVYDESDGTTVVLNCNEDARARGLPPNRQVEFPNGSRIAIRGDFFIGAVDASGNEIGLTEEQAQRWVEIASAWGVFVTNPFEYTKRGGH